ncbi:MAG: hypothetical protein NW215_07500 [Hyphomicrobiales bacterium]|nr:hypothetical protein [Hyphomicrobiales bacterium]
MDPINHGFSNPRHEHFELRDVIMQTSLMLVIQNELRRCFCKTTRRAHAVNLRLSNFFHHAVQVSFRFLHFTCFSASANTLSADAFIDVPDPFAFDEAGEFFASHVRSPYVGLGRPLRDL